MAAAASDPGHSTKVVEEGLTCSICYNFLREPKDLDCPHVYCLQCLQEWTKMKRTIECPECRHVTNVPKGGLVNLKTNLRLKNMKENYIEGKNITQKSYLMCPNHDGERQHFFCVTCGIAVCQNCLVLDHPRPQHEIKDLQAVVQSLKTKLANVQKQMETIKKQKQKLSEIERKLMEQNASLVDQMYKLNPHSKPPRVPSRTQPCTSQTEIPSIDSLRINPVSCQQKVPKQAHVGGQGKRKCKLTFLSEFGRFKLAYSVASTRDGQLAVVDLSEVVSIYEKDYVGYKRQYYLGSLQSNGNILLPTVVAVTSEDKFLVCDCSRSVVKVFSPTGRYERSWPISVVASSMATTPDDMVVVYTWSKLKRIITVHQSNGDVIRTHHAQCNGIGDIASNGKQIAFTTGGDEGKVSAIDFVTGQTLWTVDMVWPLGICFEQKSNTILVGCGLGSDRNTGHGAIEQYCSTTGHLISRVASGLYYPWGLTVTHDSKLAVADWNNVKMYQIDFE